MKLRQVKGLLLSTLTTTVLIGAATLNSFAADYKSVAKDGINLRSGPGTNYEIIYQLPEHYPLKVLEQRADWFKVEDYEGDKGWIFQSLLSSEQYVIVKVNECNLRSEPTTSAEKIGSLSKDVILKKVGEQNGWVHVSHPEITGWVYGKLVWP